MERRSDHRDGQRLGRDAVVAEPVGPGDLLCGVHPDEPGPDGLGRRRRYEVPGVPGVPGVGLVVGRHDGGDDRAVPGAAAQHTGQRVLNLLHAGMGDLGQQSVGAGQHARGAEPALRRIVAGERALQRRTAGERGEMLHRDDLRTVEAADGHHACAHRCSVDQHGAGPAVARVAAHLRPGQAEVVAQPRRQPPRRRCDGARLPVDGDPDRAHLGTRPGAHPGAHPGATPGATPQPWSARRISSGRTRVR